MDIFPYSLHEKIYFLLRIGKKIPLSITQFYNILCIYIYIYIKYIITKCPSVFSPPLSALPSSIQRILKEK
jgi:hypothetical protein